MGIQAEVLLRGAWYALEQAGLLLTDAARLHSNAAYANTTVLALLAREEIGRCNILLGLWREAQAGTDVSAPSVREACLDHVQKQSHGQLSGTFRAEGSGGLPDLLRRRSTAEPGSAERAKLDKEVQKIDYQKLKRTPSERHSMRIKAMYVGLNAAGTGWDRPRDLSHGDATNSLTDAMNDYAVKRDWFAEPQIVQVSNPELAAALRAWPERPQLPLVIWREQALK